MADEPMLGLFDGETNFLDELANTGSSEMGSSIPGGGMMPQHMGHGQGPQGKCI